MKLGYLGAKCSVQKKVNSSCFPPPHQPCTIAILQEHIITCSWKTKNWHSIWDTKRSHVSFVATFFFPPKNILLFYYPIFEFTIFFHLRLATLSLSLSCSGFVGFAPMEETTHTYDPCLELLCLIFIYFRKWASAFAIATQWFSKFPQFW